MSTMQTVNCLLALGGDRGNLVPKYGISVSELQVLRLIHGSDACSEIEPVGEIEVSDGVEVERLLTVFMRPAHVMSPVRTLYPGGRAQVHRQLDQVEDLDPTWLKATARVSTRASAVETVSLEKLTAAEAEIADLKRQLAEKQANVKTDVDESAKPQTPQQKAAAASVAARARRQSVLG